MTAVVSLPLESEQFKRLRHLAQMTRRDQAWHLRQALNRYLEQQTAPDPVEEGLADVRAGRLLDLSDIEAKWRQTPTC